MARWTEKIKKNIYQECDGLTACKERGDSLRYKLPLEIWDGIYFLPCAGQKNNHLHNEFRNYLSYLPNPSARAGYDTRSIFKWSLTGLNSEYSFS